MKNRISRTILAALLSFATLALQPSSLFAQGTAFTYQGQIKDGLTPANGSYDLTFSLFGVSSGAGQVGSSLTNSATGVTNGLFSVTLDFGANFPGANRWLEIAVRTNGGGAFNTLTPRQPITAAPYAITAGNLTGTVSATGLSGNYSSAITFNNAANSFTGNGTGLTNVNATTLGGLSSSNFWKTTGNAGANPTNGTFLGTTDNQSLEIKVNGTRALRLEPTTADPTHLDIVNVVGGSRGNFVGAGVYGATIAGGGAVNFEGDPSTNKVIADFGTVSGGLENTSSGYVATVGGGNGNTSSGEAATVAGGRVNTSSGYISTVGGGEGNDSTGENATVGGGNGNTSSGQFATVGGGLGNISSGKAATVPGGLGSSAGGDFSFAAGRFAHADHQGAFVWADSQLVNFASTAANQFLIRAAGGVGIGTSNPQYPLDVTGAVRLTTFGDGAEILNLGTERSWAFRQLRSGVGTALELASIGGGGNKDFIINTTGLVGIGTTSPGFTLHVNGTAGKPGGGSWSVASDERLKKNIRPLAGALDKLLALHGVNFEYLNPAQIQELPGERIGLVAQEVEKVFPDWVETGPDGYKRVTVRGLEALVVEALRELQQKQDARNENLAAELKAENAELKARLKRLERLMNHDPGDAE